MTHPYLQTHYYDGKLKQHPLIKGVSQCTASNKQKRVIFNNLSQQISQSTKIKGVHKKTAQKSIRNIIASIGKQPNFDPSNNLSADNLLFLICEHLERLDDPDDVLIYLSEQLSDIITSGQCPPGRSTRLWQVYIILTETDSKATKKDQNNQEN